MVEATQLPISKPTDLQVVNAIQGMMLGKAQLLDLRALQLQFVALVVNIAGLLLGMRYQTVVPLAAGLCFIVLLLYWLILFRRHLISRSVGERARRFHLMVDSLGIPLDANDIAQLLSDADTDVESLAPCIQENFYGASGPIGISRLVESTWESAFFSESLHRKAAVLYRLAFWILLAILTLGVIGVIRFVLHSASVSVQDSVANIVLTGGLGAILFELFLRGERHDQAYREIVPLQMQLCGLYQVNEVNQSTLFLVVSNYSAAVEGAPIIPNSIYVKNREKLNKQFAAIKEAADKAKALRRKQ